MKPLYPKTSLFKCCIIIILSFPILCAFGQGEFLHKGQSGVALDGFFLEGKKSLYFEDQSIVENKIASLTGAGGKVGFSFNGVVDLQMKLNVLTLKSSSLNPESKGTTISTRLVYHAVKQSDKFPLSLRLLLSYGYSKFDEVSTTVTDIDAGAGIYRRVYIHDNVSIVPTVDLMYARSEFNFVGSSAENTAEDGGAMEFSLPIALTLPRNHLIHLSPQFRYGLGNSTGSYGINIGYILPFYMSKK